ncbi:MAG: hypothetical protein PVI59_14080 [Anaerolineae bacterium]|jgi:hypothetical protein
MSVPIYLVVAYAIFWLLTFVLASTIWARQRRIQRQLMLLEERLGDEKPLST